jgi:predicted nucleic acid-binding protein
VFEDALIAATAIHHSAPLATRNVTDFDFLMNLKLINPWEYVLLAR